MADIAHFWNNEATEATKPQTHAQKQQTQLGPIDAKEKATVEKILDIDIPRLQSAMTSSVKKHQKGPQQ